jgi:hypothetical protein
MYCGSVAELDTLLCACPQKSNDVTINEYEILKV